MTKPQSLRSEIIKMLQANPGYGLAHDEYIADKIFSAIEHRLPEKKEQLAVIKRVNIVDAAEIDGYNQALEDFKKILKGE